jgi:hypothetical protein
MNQLHILIAVVASISVALGGLWILNHAYAQDNATMTVGNMTGGNATMTVGNMTGGNATMMAGNDTTGSDNATGKISCRRC